MLKNSHCLCFDYIRLIGERAYLRLLNANQALATEGVGTVCTEYGQRTFGCAQRLFDSDRTAEDSLRYGGMEDSIRGWGLREPRKQRDDPISR